jgi:hypothetical protein
MIITRSKESFRIALKNISAKGDYSIEKQGTKQIIVKDRRRILLLSNSASTDNNNNPVNVKQLFKTVKSSFSKYLRANEFNPEIIPEIYSSCFVNKELWSKLSVNTEIIHIDARHCYWRVAKVLGYISDNVYQKYVKIPDAKTLRNISLSRVTSNHKREYYSKGQKIYEVDCDISLYKLMYDNIRHYTYNNSGAVKDAIANYCIAYRVDGIYLLPEGLKKAQSIFKKNGLLFKVTKCFKADEKNCVDEDGEMKKIL